GLLACSGTSVAQSQQIAPQNPSQLPPVGGRDIQASEAEKGKGRETTQALITPKAVDDASAGLPLRMPPEQINEGLPRRMPPKKTEDLWQRPLPPPNPKARAGRKRGPVGAPRRNPKTQEKNYARPHPGKTPGVPPPPPPAIFPPPDAPACA